MIPKSCDVKVDFLTIEKIKIKFNFIFNKLTIIKCDP